MNSRPPPKKPSGSRPNVRKLLSKDSISSLASFSKHGREPSLPETREDPSTSSSTRGKAQPSTLSPLHEDEKGDEAKTPWMKEELVSSPTAAREDRNPFDEFTASKNAQSVKFKVSKATLLSEPSSAAGATGKGQDSPGHDSLRSSTSSPPPISPSRNRWDQLRQHVLPSSATPSPDPSFTSFSQLNLPSPPPFPPFPPPFPRPPRFAQRFGFRQVVNEAREAADDITRRFTDDIQKACWTIRFGDTKTSRLEREATAPGTLGSTLHLPFMSSTSLPLPNNASSNNLSGPGPFRGLRGAPSSTNLMSQTGFRTVALGNLQSIINRYASLSTKEKMYLPYEKEILSVLLVPFLSPNSGQDVNDERQLSLEVFEMIVRRWKAADTEGNIDRSLWCCKSASASVSDLRTRILSSLNSILSSGDSPLSTPLALQSILPNLALLTLHCQTYEPSQSASLVEKSNDLNFMHDLVWRIMSGECGRLDMDELEQHFQALALKTDTEDDIRQGICMEALIKCLDFGIFHQKKAILRVIEKYWPSPDLSKPSTPLRSKIHLSKLNTFLRPALTMLQESLDTSAAARLSAIDYRIITQLLIARVLPETDILTSSDDLLHDVQGLAVKVALTLLGSEVDEEDEDDAFTDNSNSEIRVIVLDWLNGKPTAWRERLKKELKGLAASGDWKVVTRIAYRLLSVLPESSRKTVVGLMIPQFQERIVDDPPESLYEPMSCLLASFASIHPQIFYKPVFACAASVKEETVARQLGILIGLSHHLPNFWTTDAEMVSVALMSDPGGGGIAKGKVKEGQPPTWGKARLGQTVVLLELIMTLKDLRGDHKQDNTLALNGSLTKVLKFVTALEARLAILVDAKERMILLPLSQRILFATLLLEIRLLTRSLKSTVWLPRIISWAMHYSDDEELNVPALPPITEDVQDEVDEIWTRLDAIYSLTKISMKPASQRRNTSVMSPKADATNSGGPTDWRERLVAARLQQLNLLPKSALCGLVMTLVALSGALKREDYVRLGPFIWDKCLTLNDAKAVLHACFICMQSAEKVPDRFVALLLARLQSPNATVRKATVQRLAILTNWRFQLLSVTYITDRNYRRPFKLARPPLNFVATDVGDSKYIPDDDLEESASGKGHALPLDIRRRLNEIGWDDEEKPVDQHLEWRRTPMSLLSSTQLDQISTSDGANDDSRLSDQSPSPSPTSSRNSPSLSSRIGGGLLRRNSSASGRHTGKRRPVFVQPLVAIFLPLAKLTVDRDISVASLARDLLVDYMRDDPSVVCRPVLEIFSERTENICDAVTTLRTFLHLSRVLPPRLTHHVFNHLAGFLKFLAKDPSAAESLHNLAQLVPVLAKFAPQVSEMTVRAIRRGKIEMFLFPSGSLYFSESAPSGPMFPKGPLPSSNPFENYPKSLVDLIMTRMSQNLFFVEMLKRSPQDVHIIRKSWTPVVLPDVPDVFDNIEVIPRRPVKKPVPEHRKSAIRLSLSFARTHLLFVAQVFRCLTRHLNSREELAMFLDGVNRILLRHGDDIGIVSHALIVYMIASTRFRRLVSSAGGFTIFLPFLIKVYCEAEGDSGIRDAIEYAVHRFFAVHEEVFVYQTLQIVSGFVVLPSADGGWISSRVYHLLATLKSMTMTNDAAGIRDANRAQEEETALAITADERPQIFLASLRKENKSGAEKLKSSLSAEIFDKKRFHPDNIIRMLLTVVAHDPTVRRAQYFVRLFRYLVSDLYEASSSARNVLKEAVEALGTIIATKANKAKGAENMPKANDKFAEVSKTDMISTHKLFDNPSLPCDVQVMRADYLFIFATYVRCGGAHRDAGLQKALEIARSILKETSASSESIDSVRLFLEQIGESFGKRQDVKYAVTLLKEFAVIIRAHGSVLDLSGLFRSLVTLCFTPTFSNDKKFSNVVVSQICSAALETCEMAAQENILSSLKFVPSLVTLLVQSVCLLGSDVVAELERRDPSPAFLCGVVLPFVFQLRTTDELATQTQWTDSWRQDAHAHAWVRLLSYTLSILQNQRYTNLRSHSSLRRSASFTSDEAEPSNEIDHEASRGTIRKAKRRPSGHSSVAVSIRLAMAFITLKALVIRGEDDISTVFSGAWMRIGTVLRYVLRDGNAMFALHSLTPSVPPSPAISPLSSTTFIEMMDKATENKHKRFSSSTSDVFLSAPSHSSRPSSPTRIPSRRNSSQQYPCPRFVDYLTWSLLEFLCLHRSPLSIQLRTFMFERMVLLNELLQESEAPPGNSSFISPARRKSLRPPSTMYTKPRYRSSPAATTPEASPRLGPSDPNISVAGNLASLHGAHGLARTDQVTPPSRKLKGRPPIRHLGITTPLPNSFLSPSFVPTSTSADSNLSQSLSTENIGQDDMVLDAREALSLTTLRSSGLVKRTYERIRTVQRCLGYNTYLPVPGSLQVTVEAVSNNFGTSFSGTGHVSSNVSPRASIVFSAEEEPEIRAWTKRKTILFLMSEAEDLLRAWQVESGITASVSDAGHGIGEVSMAVAVEGNFDIGSPSAGEKFS